MIKITLFIYLMALMPFVFAQEKTEEPKKKEEKSAKNDPSDKPRMIMIYNSLQTDGTMSGNTGTIKTYDFRYEGMLGTPYFIDEWLSGKLIGSNGVEETKTSLLKYDSFNKSLFVKRPNGDSIMIFNSQISGFIINDQSKNVSYPFVKVENLKTDGGIKPVVYLMVLYKNKTGLLKYMSKSILKANYQGAYSVDRRYDSYTDNSEYFIQKADNSFLKVRIKKNSILEILADKKEQIEAFVKKENLSFKNEIDVAKVLAFYDGLF